MSSRADNVLTAIYHNGDLTHKFASRSPSTLAAAPTAATDVQAKTAYLSSLRSGVLDMQASINVFLTQKMEDDKASADGGAKALADEKEEEMYGEEDPGNDA